MNAKKPLGKSGIIANNAMFLKHPKADMYSSPQILINGIANKKERRKYEYIIA